MEIASVESALGADGRETLFADDFEEGTLASLVWSASGDVAVQSDAAESGEYAVQLGARAALTLRLDTRGQKRLKLAFSARTLELRGFESLRIEVAIGDQRRYLPIAHVQDCDWSRRVVPLPRFVEGRAEVRVRFVVLASRGSSHRSARDHAWHEHKRGHGRDRDRALLDDVRVTAARRSSDCEPIDAGPPDADLPDAAEPDAGDLDAGLPDAAVPDASLPDASLPDATAPDAGVCASDADCEDGDVCDGRERCEAGRCTAGTALRCDDGEACTVDRCDPTAGCLSQPGLGLPCDEGGVCDAEGSCGECVTPENTYDAIQLRIFDSPRYVCTSCHRAGGRLLDLTAANSYPALLGQTGGRVEVTPGDPETSILYDRLRAKVEGTVPVLGGNPMPRGNAPAITRAELAAIRLWIAVGAPRNGVVPGTEAVLCVPPAERAVELTTGP